MYFTDDLFLSKKISFSRFFHSFLKILGNKFHLQPIHSIVDSSLILSTKIIHFSVVAILPSIHSAMINKLSCVIDERQF